MIETARRMGFAARFVTGYLYSPGGTNQGAGATHAWCEVFLPRLGWIEFDPTNGLVESRDLIRVAATRTPEEASPMKGEIVGKAGSRMTVLVDVTQADGLSVAAA
jgi:transglutaminase-like putative cysteine protease